MSQFIDIWILIKCFPRTATDNAVFILADDNLAENNKTLLARLYLSTVFLFFFFKLNSVISFYLEWDVINK